MAEFVCEITNLQCLWLSDLPGFENLAGLKFYATKLETLAEFFFHDLKTLDNKDKLEKKTDDSKEPKKSKKSSSNIPEEPNLEREGRTMMPSLAKWEQMM